MRTSTKWPTRCPVRQRARELRARAGPCAARPPPRPPRGPSAARGGRRRRAPPARCALGGGGPAVPVPVAARHLPRARGSVPRQREGRTGAVRARRRATGWRGGEERRWEENARACAAATHLLRRQRARACAPAKCPAALRRGRRGAANRARRLGRPRARRARLRAAAVGGARRDAAAAAAAAIVTAQHLRRAWERILRQRAGRGQRRASRNTRPRAWKGTCAARSASARRVG